MLKTWEVYKIALENPKARFTSKNSPLVYFFENDKPRFMISDKSGGSEVSYDLLDLNGEWELKREPVDFMTAINSGKNIKSCTNASFHSVDWYLRIGCALVEINGLWEIE